MKYLKSYNEPESTKVIIDYDIFNNNYQYRYALSQDILKKVEDEVRDEILEFFYSLIDDLNPKDIKSNIDLANTWSYSIANSFQNYTLSSSGNCLSKSMRDFTTSVIIKLSGHDPSNTIDQAKSIYDNLVSSGYLCKYVYENKVVESNIPQNGKKGIKGESIDISFHICIKGEDVLPRIGIDINQLK